jgi:hypothetical protein
MLVRAADRKRSIAHQRADLLMSDAPGAALNVDIANIAAKVGDVNIPLTEPYLPYERLADCTLICIKETPRELL